MIKGAVRIRVVEESKDKPTRHIRSKSYRPCVGFKAACHMVEGLTVPEMKKSK